MILIQLVLLLTPCSLFALTLAGTGDSGMLLQGLAVAFARQHSEIRTEIPPSVGSSGGIRMLLQGRTDMARVARHLDKNEAQQGLHWQQFAVVPIVFTANLPQHCVVNLSSDQVLNIFSGRYNRWSQLGNCPDHKIYLARREVGDSSNRVLREKIPGLKALTKQAGRTIYTTAEAFNTIKNHAYTLGYLPLSQLAHTTLTPLAYNGVPAERQTLLSGQYPLQIPLALVWKDPLTEAAKKFLDFLKSNEATEIIYSFGAVPFSRKGL